MIRDVYPGSGFSIQNTCTSLWGIGPRCCIITCMASNRPKISYPRLMGGRD
jgi:hypothetical protein